MLKNMFKAMETAINERLDDLSSRLESLKNYIYKRDSISIEERIYRYIGYMESDFGFLTDFKVDDRILYHIEQNIIEVSCFVKYYDVTNELVSSLEKTAIKYRENHMARFGSEPVCYSEWMAIIKNYKTNNSEGS